ncbi:type IV pilus modification protein PilV [Solilutibacter silvestris]|uniref:type IV pilus modification protein PilV n=1 Tax=Solilutibacter silvestris TaxID=1645665 RepID=UPI000CA07E3C|nr:type IV pilus modification protein PilV [Lysobacter silvestris]
MQISARRQAGVGMIEVMVAVLVLAIGILGIAALQAITLKNAGSSAERTQALVHVYEMGDVLRANRTRLTAFDTGGYMCKADAVASTDPVLKDWLDRLTTDVSPSACGTVSCNGGTLCDVGVRWDDTRGTGGSTPSASGDIRTNIQI